MITRKLFRVRLQRMLRNTRLLKPAENLRYYLKLLELKTRNKKFIESNPGFSLPPAHLAFDAYSSPHWEFYKTSGEVTARFLYDLVNRHRTEHVNSIYEWGCGPARVIRQLKTVFEEPVEVYGSDYNPESMEWCSNNLKGIHFHQNDLQPPLIYADQSFDFIYAISVITHLSESNSIAWINELKRVLKPGGVLMITSNGDRSYSFELLQDEKKQYEEKGIVVRAGYDEGKKMFLAMHSPTYMKEVLLEGFELLEHIPTGFPYMNQDYWLVRKSVRNH